MEAQGDLLPPQLLSAMQMYAVHTVQCNSTLFQPQSWLLSHSSLPLSLAEGRGYMYVELCAHIALNEQAATVNENGTFNK